jgi:hypothetical protein
MNVPPGDIHRPISRAYVPDLARCKNPALFPAQRAQRTLNGQPRSPFEKELKKRLTELPGQ